MHLLVDNIIAPYFETTKKELSLPPDQYSIWEIDCWSVHRSAEFHAWMKKYHPTIIIIYIPGGCTGVWQPLDVGFQHLLKLSIKCSVHRDTVDEALAQIAAGKPGSEITLKTNIGTLRDRSVGWIVEAMRELDDPGIIKKVRRLHSQVSPSPYLITNYHIRHSRCVESVTSICPMRVSRHLRRWQDCAVFDTRTPPFTQNLRRPLMTLHLKLMQKAKRKTRLLPKTSMTTVISLLPSFPTFFLLVML
ncbi:hypothetical protein K438DRAFT_1624742 [Mycena galopus ATCC 62051]|nr:hypothetical protein K438DRAFT_1624742 [Mycena galopus ATCC 62051]